MKLLNNRQWIYSKRPERLVSNEHYSLRRTLFSFDKLKVGEATIKAKYFCVDPYIHEDTTIRK